VKKIKDMAEQHCKATDLEFDNLVNRVGPGSMTKQGTHMSKIDYNKQYGGRFTNMPK
jgi:hypothetical protein